MTYGSRQCHHARPPKSLAFPINRNSNHLMSQPRSATVHCGHETWSTDRSLVCFDFTAIFICLALALSSPPLNLSPSRPRYPARASAACGSAAVLHGTRFNYGSTFVVCPRQWRFNGRWKVEQTARAQSRMKDRYIS